ncbi:MAG: hypothetical protein CVV44_17385 [Spirochaetae bacterium HGW-Spirochaetae-1]|nr:MAG: hypothetical protein CVV44_17385 [Spirochaetae bacterium HGW-Spirochaetae-1]
MLEGIENQFGCHVEAEAVFGVGIYFPQVVFLDGRFEVISYFNSQLGRFTFLRRRILLFFLFFLFFFLLFFFLFLYLFLFLFFYFLDRFILVDFYLCKGDGRVREKTGR